MADIYLKNEFGGALVTENAVKLTDEVGFLTNYYMKRRKTVFIRKTNVYHT